MLWLPLPHLLLQHIYDRRRKHRRGWHHHQIHLCECNMDRTADERQLIVAPCAIRGARSLLKKLLGVGLV